MLYCKKCEIGHIAVEGRAYLPIVSISGGVPKTSLQAALEYIEDLKIIPDGGFYCFNCEDVAEEVYIICYRCGKREEFASFQEFIKYCELYPVDRTFFKFYCRGCLGGNDGKEM